MYHYGIGSSSCPCIDMAYWQLPIIIAGRTFTADAALLSLSCARKSVTSSLCIQHRRAHRHAPKSGATALLYTMF